MDRAHCASMFHTWNVATTAAVAAILLFAPTASFGCACGCGVFDVGTSSMFPSGSGGTVFLEYDYQDQNKNWSGDSRASAANNADKVVQTHFLTLGAQYMFDRSWGMQVEVPYWDRKFSTDTNFGNGPANVMTSHWADLGDIRIKGIYTGFSDDLSTGVTYGLKLPSGNFTHGLSTFVDRDTEIGSGSTDILLGAFHRGDVTDDNIWSWFVQGQVDQPVFTQAAYRPGSEIDAASGVHYNGWSIGNVQITPVAQVIASKRTRDSGGASANPVASGYQRLLLSPGLEADFGRVMAYADVEVPVYAHVTGNQLVAPELFKVILSYMF